jgi:trypsin-like peptidase/colicin V production protein
LTLLDWLIVAFTALLALFGALQGFLVGILSLVGFAAGAAIGSRVVPLLLHGGARSPYAPLFGLLGAILLGGLLASGLGGLGARARARVTAGLAGGFDAALGAVLGAALGLGAAWVAGAVALQTPGARTLRRDVQRSAILRRLNDVLPPSGPLLHALARFDPVPRIAGPEARVPPPRAAIARKPAVRAAAGSVVRVVGTACGLGLEGSGWVAGPGLVVTNAHVVAGESDTEVQVHGEPPGLSAHAVAFDPRNDVAVLRVDGLDRRALPLARHPRAGTSAAIVGYPHNGPLSIRAARIGRTQTVISNDAYGRGPLRRRMTPLRGAVRAGNSGGPAVDVHGRVVTTVFAATTSGPEGGFGVPDEVVARDLRRARGPVSTGPCTR